MENSVVNKVNYIRSELSSAIISFDKKTKPIMMFRNNKIEHETTGHYDLLRTILLPFLLNTYFRWDIITKQQCESFLSQLSSPDRENWYIAFLLIKNIKPYKVKKK